ncbi:MAG: hypothetical protein KY476_07040 [Planctomycetes bacterium]|nr:hypothetical protein [Planctomycetota bacterium]
MKQNGPAPSGAPSSQLRQLVDEFATLAADLLQFVGAVFAAALGFLELLEAAVAFADAGQVAATPASS